MEYLLAGVLVLIFVFGFLRTKHLWIRQETQVVKVQEPEPAHWSASITPDTPEEYLLIARKCASYENFSEMFPLAILQTQMYYNSGLKTEYVFDLHAALACKSITSPFTPPNRTDTVTEPTIAICTQMVQNPERFTFGEINCKSYVLYNGQEFLVWEEGPWDICDWEMVNQSLNNVERIVVRYYTTGLLKAMKDANAIEKRRQLSEMFSE